VGPSKSWKAEMEKRRSRSKLMCLATEDAKGPKIIAMPGEVKGLGLDRGSMGDG
jgi:hypothetical protein